MKRQGIGSPRNLHDHFIGLSFPGIILSELRPQPAGLDTDCGIESGVKVRRPAKDINRELVFLDRNTRVSDGLLG